MLYAFDAPGQLAPFEVVALALNVTVTGAAVEFVKVMAGIVVVPLVGVTTVTPAGGVQFQVMFTDGVADDMVTSAVAV